MSQHDYNIANGDGATVRADLNALFQAIAENNSGSTAPPVTFAHMWWFDTATNELKQRNTANNGWVVIGTRIAGVWTPALGGAVATVAEIHAGTATDKIITPAVAAQAMARVSLTPAANVALDLSTGINFDLGLDQNSTLSNPTNVVVWRPGLLRIFHSGGPWTLAFGSEYKFFDGTVIAIQPGINVISYWPTFSNRVVLAHGGGGVA